MSDTHFSKVIGPGDSIESLLNNPTLIAVKNCSSMILEIGCPSVRLEPGRKAVVCAENGYVQAFLAKGFLMEANTNNDIQPSHQESTSSVPTGKRGRPKSTAQNAPEEGAPQEPFFETVAQDEPQASVQLETLEASEQPAE